MLAAGQGSHVGRCWDGSSGQPLIQTALKHTHGLGTVTPRRVTRDRTQYDYQIAERD
jgi:hypothetical protein